MILTFFIIVAFIGVVIGSYTDIKTLEVPDWLNYTMIAVGIGGSIIYSLYLSDYLPILRSIMGFGVAFAIGMLMFYTGQWGGGDSKVLFGLGALLGLDLPLESSFFLKFLVNILFAGAAYGVLWVVGMAIKNYKDVGKKIKESLKDKKLLKIRIYSGIFAAASLLLIYFIPADVDPRLQIIFSVLIIMLYFMNYIFIVVRAVEQASMIKFITPDKLTEGDWIVDEIKIEGEYITGPKDLGIEKKNIEKLLGFYKQGKIKKVKVKYGIPFVPSFLFALVYTMIINEIVLFQFI